MQARRSEEAALSRVTRSLMVIERSRKRVITRVSLYNYCLTFPLIKDSFAHAPRPAARRPGTPERSSRLGTFNCANTIIIYHTWAVAPELKVRPVGRCPQPAQHARSRGVEFDLFTSVPVSSLIASRGRLLRVAPIISREVFRFAPSRESALNEKSLQNISVCLFEPFNPRYGRRMVCCRNTHPFGFLSNHFSNPICCLQLVIHILRQIKANEIAKGAPVFFTNDHRFFIR